MQQLVQIPVTTRHAIAAANRSIPTNRVSACSADGGLRTVYAVGRVGAVGVREVTQARGRLGL